MAKITSKSQINVGVELTINEPARTFTLNVAGNLIAKDGVSIQALYSKFIDLWTVSSYQDSPFPIYTIDALSGQFQFGTDGATYSGWKPANDATRQTLRDGGWSEFNASGVLARQYVGIVSLGVVSAGSQLYYQKINGGISSNFTFIDAVNEGIQVYGDISADATTTTFDTRTYFKGYVREFQKKYKDSILADTGKTSTGANLVNLLLANEDDLKITANDATMTTGIYAGINISYYTANQTKNIGGVSYPFRIIVTNTTGTLEQIYTKIQYFLRQNSNINTGGTDGTKVGKIQDSLMNFVGETLVCNQSVFIDNILSADLNRVTFIDQNSISRLFPFASAGIINSNANLTSGGTGYYRMFFTTNPAGNYGTATAVTVNDKDGVPITGTIAGSTINFTFDYDGNVQGGRTAGANANITLVAGNPGKGKPVVSIGIIDRSKAISISLVAETDRAYI
tara:strand:- start:1072 stop:2433 length:1362 start_codon:yes stop_codon:yes gene_type:complete